MPPKQNAAQIRSDDAAAESSDRLSTGANQTTTELPPKKTRIPQAFSSFRHRNYQLWFIGQLVSVVGTWMQIIAQGWLVYEISHSEFALGLVGFASAIPVLFVSPWGGVVVDRVPKQVLLVTTQSVSMILAFILAALSFTHTVQVWHIVLLAVIIGVVNSFDSPARQAMVVDMVAREDVANAIALNSTIYNGARVIGPAIGGLLLASLGASWCFLINGFSFLAVIGSLLAMKFPAITHKITQVHPWEQFLEGLHYARQHREIIALLGLTAVFTMFGTAYSSILPAFIDQVLHAGAAVYGTINTCIGAGAVVAALLIAQYGGFGKRGLILTGANLLYPIVLAVFAFNNIVAISMLLSFFLGAGFMLLLNSINSLLQLRVEDHMRGRVMSLYTICIFGLSPFGTLGIGAAAEIIPMSITIAISALLTLVLAVLILLKVPEVKNLQ